MRTATVRSFQILCLALVAGLPGFGQCQTDADCSPSSDVCQVVTCNTTTHTCQTAPFPCTDNDPCTVNDRCTPGVDSNGNAIPKCKYDKYLCPPPINPC